MPRPASLRQSFARCPLVRALGRLRAGAGRSARFVRWCVPLSAGCPWTLGAQVRRAPPAGAWHDGARGCSFVAYGKLACVTDALGRAGRPRARALLQRVLPALPVAAVLWDSLPVLLGSAAFFRAPAKHQPACVPWPRARPLWLPRTLCWRHGSRTLLVLTAPLPHTATARAALVARWRREAAGWQRAAAAVAAAGPQATGAALAAADVLAPRRCRLQPLQTADAFCGRVRAALRQIEEGRVRKLVLAQAVRLHAPAATRFDLWASARRLRALQPEAAVFCFAHRGGHGFVGATPELLAAGRGRQVASQALAGTRVRAATAAADAAARRALLRSAKDRAEHAEVVRGVLAALAPCCCRRARVPPPVARQTRQLWHLHAPVRATLRPGRDLLDAVAALHPSPAVGGAPTALALRLLRAQEPWRGDFAGPTGWLTVNGGFFVVAIRSSWVTPRRAYAFAGAGVVAGSVPSAEWRETCAKLDTAMAGLVLRQVARPGTKGARRWRIVRAKRAVGGC